ncbi:MAG: MotA/TolQ/ExbB proton channel family protein [Alphaproteobacteria bacterium]|nr:MotA/TolQ/ExbB proton channel family protein [Alphaproteobacteria bacterium]
MDQAGLSDAPEAVGLLGQMLGLLETGGPVVGILFALSVVAMAIVIAKLWQFAALSVGKRRAAEQGIALLRRGQPMEALLTVERSTNPTAQALALVIRGQRRGIDEARIREEVQCFCQDQLSNLRSWLKPLEVIGALAPLLGLLGTVLGMIEAFRQLELAGSQVDPSILSGGIWEALLTTAVGLAVAIPAVVASTWFEQRLERLSGEMETLIPRAFTEDLSDHMPQERDHGSAVASVAGHD